MNKKTIKIIITLFILIGAASYYFLVVQKPDRSIDYCGNLEKYLTSADTPQKDSDSIYAPDKIEKLSIYTISPSVQGAGIPGRAYYSWKRNDFWIQGLATGGSLYYGPFKGNPKSIKCNDLNSR